MITMGLLATAYLLASGIIAFVVGRAAALGDHAAERAKFHVPDHVPAEWSEAGR